MKKAALIIFFLLSCALVKASWECEWEEKQPPDVYSEENISRAFFDEESFGKITALGLIRLYQVTLSGRTGTECNFYPSCSRYGFFAIKKYGAIKGIIMANDRLFRCHEWSYTCDYPVDYGHALLYDPVEANDTFNFIFDWLNF